MPLLYTVIIIIIATCTVLYLVRIKVSGIVV
jgi:hypothetical protein